MLPVPIANLIGYTAQFVTEKDIEDFSLNDPSYGLYVRTWTAIRKRRSCPVVTPENSFEISEIIMTSSGWVDHGLRLGDRAYLARARRFRLYTTAVAVGLHMEGALSSHVSPGNYSALRLLTDVVALPDKNLRDRLPMVFELMLSHLESDCDNAEESLFVILGQLLLARMKVHGAPDAEATAETLLERESQFPSLSSPEFLWGKTFYDSHHAHWQSLVSDWLPKRPETLTMQLIKDELTKPFMPEDEKKRWYRQNNKC